MQTMLIKIIKTLTLIAFLIIILKKEEGMSEKQNNERVNVLIKKINKDRILDPAKLRYVAEYYYIENMTLRLIEFDRDGQYKNQLAKKITLSKDRKDLTIQIKEAYFSDGKKISIEDVYFSIKRAILLGTPHFDGKSIIRGASKINNMNDDFEGLQILSNDTLKIGLVNPMKEIFYFLHLTDFAILHPSQYMKQELKAIDWTGHISGPYRLRYLDDGDLEFIANDKSLNYHIDMPQKISIKEVDESNFVASLNNQSIDFGVTNFKTYEKNYKILESVDKYDLFGAPSDGLGVIVLNLQSEKFKNPATRKWFLKRILSKYKIDEDQLAYMKKANQYFLPGAKGHLADLEISSILGPIEIESIPPELKSGIVIKSVNTIDKYLPADFKFKLEDALGIPVNFEFDVDPDKDQYLSKRNFDLYTTSISMSYKVLGESLNMSYIAEDPLFLDPTGKIKQLLKEYQAEEDPSKETSYIRQILLQMVEDAECVPVFYYLLPKFFNKDKLDISNMNFEESFQFWRMRVKE